MNEIIEQIMIWSQSVEWLNAVLSVAVIVLPTLVAAWLLLFAGEKTVRQAGAAWREVRQLIDQPTDPAILFLAARLRMTPEQVIQYLTDNLDSIFPEQGTPGGAVK